MQSEVAWALPGREFARWRNPSCVGPSSRRCVGGDLRELTKRATRLVRARIRPFAFRTPLRMADGGEETARCAGLARFHELNTLARTTHPLCVGAQSVPFGANVSGELDDVDPWFRGHALGDCLEFFLTFERGDALGGVEDEGGRLLGLGFDGEGYCRCGSGMRCSLISVWHRTDGL